MLCADAKPETVAAMTLTTIIVREVTSFSLSISIMFSQKMPKILVRAAEQHYDRINRARAIAIDRQSMRNIQDTDEIGQARLIYNLEE